MSDGLLQALKGFEGWDTGGWDYGQYSTGYGTKARYPGEKIDRDEGDRRLRSEIGPAVAFVDKNAPGLPPGVRDAMISLTYNAGTSWATSGLGAQLRAGDYEGARETFQKYTKAGGRDLPALEDRRKAEAQWWDGDGAMPQQASLTSGRQRMPGLIGSLGGDSGERPRGGLLGSLGDPETLAYVGYLAKAFSPYSSVDPEGLLKLAQSKANQERDNWFRMQHLGLSQRAQDRQDSEFGYKQQLMKDSRSADSEIYGNAGKDGMGREQILDYMKRYPDMSKSTRDFLEKRLDTFENQGKITRENTEREAEATRMGLEGVQKQQYILNGKMSDQDKPIPAELSGRLALADTFLKKAPKIAEEIDKGTVTGVYDTFMARQGIGKQGMVHGDIQSGVDALRRMLTGAGMPQTEADEYVQRYQPSYKDTSATLKYKHERLVEELTGMRDNIMRGRGSTPSPSSQGGGQGSQKQRLRFNPKTGDFE